MAFADSSYTGDNSTTEFTISFPFIAQSHVVVTVDGTTQTNGTDYTINTTTNKVVFTTAPASSTAVRIYRSSSQNTRVVDFTTAPPQESDLDNSALQSLYIQQEILDEQQTWHNTATAGELDNENDTLQVYDASEDAVKQKKISEVITGLTGVTVNGMTDVVDDGSPQLGGNLDVNGNSIVSAANGDIAITPDGTGNVILDGIKHPKADGSSGQILETDGAGQLSFIDPPFVKLATLTANNDPTLDAVDVFDGTYSYYKVIIKNLIPASDDTTLRLLLSSNSGSSYVTAGYHYINDTTTITSGNIQAESSSASSLFLTHIANAGYMISNTDGVSATLEIMSVDDAAETTTVCNSGYESVSQSRAKCYAVGGIADTTVYDSVRFSFAAGNITSGTIEIYGIK